VQITTPFAENLVKPCSLDVVSVVLNEVGISPVLHPYCSPWEVEDLCRMDDERAMNVLLSTTTNFQYWQRKRKREAILDCITMFPFVHILCTIHSTS
jgi:hypothetical protein